MSFRIDVYDGNTLLLVPDALDESDYEKFLRFPEKKWRNNTTTGLKGWSVPVTGPNIEYLEANWVKGKDYTINDGAKLLLKFEKLNTVIDEFKAAKRWEYLFEGKKSDFGFPSALPPFDHQRVTVEAAYGSPYFGLLMEMGTGKTKCFIDESQRYIIELKEGETMRIIIVCPKSLIGNWEREFYKNYPDLFDFKIACLNKGEFKAVGQITELLTDDCRVKILIVSQDSVATLLKYLRIFRATMLGIDESHYLKNPGTQRWKAVKSLSETAAMRRILTGTPISNNIMDVWSQFELLRPGVLGYSTYAAFKHAFAEVNDWCGHETVTGYQEDKLPELKEAMAKCSFIVKKSQCLDLPPKMYDTVLVDMPEAMRTIYDKFEKEFHVDLGNSTSVTTEHVIVQMMKLAQICSGFVSAIKELDTDEVDEDGGPMTEHTLEFIPGGDTKMNIMLDQAEDVMKEGKLIIWSRFKLDNEIIYRRLTERGWVGGKYDSTVNDRTREYNKLAFGDLAKSGPTMGDDNFRFLVGSPKAGGVGLTLLGTERFQCSNVFYYANDFSFGTRDQSEDRAHRIGTRKPVLYKDFAYRDSIEEEIAKVLQDKKMLAAMVKNVGSIKDILLKRTTDV